MDEQNRLQTNGGIDSEGYKPGQPNIIDIQDGKITISWTPPAFEGQRWKYRIECHSPSEKWVQLPRLIDETCYEVTDLKMTEVYQFRIGAADGHGNIKGYSEPSEVFRPIKSDSAQVPDHAKLVKSGYSRQDASTGKQSLQERVLLLELQPPVCVCSKSQQITVRVRPMNELQPRTKYKYILQYKEYGQMAWTKEDNNDKSFELDAAHTLSYLPENKAYVFQASITSTDGQGPWSCESHPIKAQENLVLSVGNVLPRKGKKKQQGFTINISEFLVMRKDIKEQSHLDQQNLFTSCGKNVMIDTKHTKVQPVLNGILNFTNKVVEAMAKKPSQRYQGIQIHQCGSLFSNLRVGMPYEADLVLEMTDLTSCDKDIAHRAQITYDQCKTIDNDKGYPGTHMYVVQSKQRHWIDEGTKTTLYGKFKLVSSKKILQLFWKDVIEASLKMQYTEPDWVLHGWKKHKRGICAVMQYKNEGVLIDLIPAIKLQSLTASKYHPKPIPIAASYRNQQIPPPHDLFLVCEEDDPNNEHGGAWSLSTSEQEHAIFCTMDEEFKIAMRIVKFIFQSYIVDGRPDIDPQNENKNKDDKRFTEAYVPVQDKKYALSLEKSLALYGVKTALPSHLLQILVIKILVHTYKREEYQELKCDNLVFLILQTLYKIVQCGGDGYDMWVDALKDMEHNTSCGFLFKDIPVLRRYLRKLQEPGFVKLLLEPAKNQLLNYPVKENALDVSQVKPREAKDYLTPSSDALFIDKDTVKAKEDSNRPESDRIVFMDTPLTDSWVVSAEIIAMGKEDLTKFPLYAGICREKLDTENISSFKDLNGCYWRNVQDIKRYIQEGTEIETQWKSERGDGAVHISVDMDKGIIKDNVPGGYFAFLVLPPGMEIRYAAFQQENRPKPLQDMVASPPPDPVVNDADDIITVKTQALEQFKYPYSSQTNISRLKEFLAAKLDIPINYLKLLYNENEISTDAHTLAEAGISANTEISLRICNVEPLRDGEVRLEVDDLGSLASLQCFVFANTNIYKVVDRSNRKLFKETTNPARRIVTRPYIQFQDRHAKLQRFVIVMDKVDDLVTHFVLTVSTPNAALVPNVAQLLHLTYRHREYDSRFDSNMDAIVEPVRNVMYPKQPSLLFQSKFQGKIGCHSFVVCCLSRDKLQRHLWNFTRLGHAVDNLEASIKCLIHGGL